jgi:hypothetical protein
MTLTTYVAIDQDMKLHCDLEPNMPRPRRVTSAGGFGNRKNGFSRARASGQSYPQVGVACMITRETCMITRGVGGLLGVEVF